MYGLIKRPLVTEKNSVQNARGVYVFEVDPRADKEMIKRAVEKAFSVKVSSVRTLVCRDRVRRIGKTVKPRKMWKKAFVQVRAGEKIKIFEGA